MIPECRVVVTGLGLVSSAGIGHRSFWEGMTAGNSYVRRITRFDASQMPVQIASEIDDSLLAPHLNGVVPTIDNRIFLYADIAGELAYQDSGLTPADLDSRRAGVVVGTSVGPSLNAAVAYMEGRDTGQNGSSGAGQWTRPFPAELGRRLNRRFKLQGFSAVVSTGCASGADAVGVALEAVQWGQSDVIFAMGVEAPIEPLTINAFDAVGALSHCNHDPAHASRPFDKDRDGFILGEGAAVLVMERLEHAVARGARIYGEVRGYGTTTDAYHMTAPRHDLSKAVIAVRKALAAAGVTPDDIDYISAHATSTPLGDLIETRLIKRVFGERAYSVPVSSTKSIIGHQSGGSGAFQAAANLLMLQYQKLIPTVNLQVSGKDCDLDYVASKVRPAKVDCVLQQTFGFSGKNSALVIAKTDYPWPS
jgi:3-oxoacyl-[acyl-carrier-protein] synthase II